MTVLRLNTEFAHMFEFRKLHGCLALAKLSLHMRTEHRKHIRLITRADLLVPGSTTADGSIQEQEQERIVALKLWKLHKDGHWSFEDPSILSHFVGGMFPQLSQLTARAWDGVTFGSYVTFSRQ
ncbi:hypothetical protein K457DRAFT_289474 [Linnemannia elongata AG-77]|uniref:Uncharacterized protein n=1 Tax=Linnemannia elongata AG-77 TaxID=1314771 RepID=A0A197K650_9FUNG|nr:hypothetical protein K457DRAFT_289474 [Linnemannia elongata AG-77]